MVKVLVYTPIVAVAGTVTVTVGVTRYTPRPPEEILKNLAGLGRGDVPAGTTGSEETPLVKLLLLQVPAIEQLAVTEVISEAVVGKLCSVSAVVNGVEVMLKFHPVVPLNKLLTVIGSV